MQEEIFKLIEQHISSQRLLPYRCDDSDTNQIVLARYFWNVALCESLYSILQHLEIALRNSIHIAAQNYFKDEFWFKRQEIKEKLYWKYDDEITEAEKDLKKAGKQLHGGAIIAQLSFGFWVYECFGKDLEQVLLYKTIKAIFPHMPNKERTRQPIHNKLHEILRLRNRVFHHEPVWNKKNLQSTYNDILYLIGSINPELKNLVEKFDRFKSVYKENPMNWAP